MILLEVYAWGPYNLRYPALVVPLLRASRLRAHEGDMRYAFTDGAVIYIILLPLYVDRSDKLF